MPSEIKSFTAEDLRLRNYRSLVQQRHEMEMRDIEAKHGQETLDLTEQSKNQLNELRKAYDVQISREAEELEERLAEIRARKDEKIKEEEHQTETELSKARNSQQTRLQEYKKNAESQLDALRKQYQNATDNLNAQAAKNQKLQNAKKA